jgi:hypothetical protein
MTKSRDTADILEDVRVDGNVTAVGQETLKDNTGAHNTGVGYRAMFNSSMSGASNVALGNYNLYSNTSGANNTALGYQSLFLNTTASNNTAVGYQAMYSNTTGTVNASFGRETLASNTTGQSNTAFGTNALYANTTAKHNTAVGYQAGYNNITGQHNAFLGKEAGYNSTSDFNTYLGNNAGSLMTSGSQNTIIGRYDGNQSGLDIRTSSNNIVLSDGAGNPRLRIDSGGTAIFDNSVSGQNNNVLVVNSDYPSSGTNTMYMEADGDIATRSGSYGTISDQRLKQQITTANSQWDDVKAAVVKKYKFNADVEEFADDAPEQIGWIAQELETAGLNGVVKDGQDGFKSVKTTVLMIKAFKALQEAMARIETLETKVATLEG